MNALNDIYLPHLKETIRRSRWVVCKDCALVFQNPRPVDALMSTLYEGGFYHSLNAEKFTAPFLEAKRRHVEKQLNWIRDQVGSPAAVGRALDVGCGVGISLDVLRQRGWEVHGFEPDPQLAAFGNKEFDLGIVPRPFADGTFPPGHFNLIYTHHTYEHLSDPLEMTRWLRKITAEDGILFFSIPTYPWSFHFFSWEWMNVCHNTIFTHKTFANMLAAAGLRLTGHRYDPYGEVWILASPSKAGVPAPTYKMFWRREQFGLWASPLLFLLGLFHRAVWRLVRDPKYFFKRLGRVFRCPGR
ncbi:MAG: class I SAM-dependent methyltransferase [Elusimicrobiota bacterium]